MDYENAYKYWKARCEFAENLIFTVEDFADTILEYMKDNPEPIISGKIEDEGNQDES